MTIKKSISVFSLILVLLMPSLVFFAYRIQQWQVRHEMEEALESAWLEKVSIPADQVEWVEKGKELIINGKLFDVKSATTQGSLIIFTGLFDEKETTIRERIMLAQQQSGQEQESDRLTLRLISFVWYTDQLPAIDSFSLIIDNSNNLYPESTAILSELLSNPSPPPKV